MKQNVTLRHARPSVGIHVTMNGPRSDSATCRRTGSHILKFGRFHPFTGHEGPYVTIYTVITYMYPQYYCTNYCKRYGIPECTRY